MRVKAVGGTEAAAVATNADVTVVGAVVVVGVAGNWA